MVKEVLYFISSTWVQSLQTKPFKWLTYCLPFFTDITPTTENFIHRRLSFYFCADYKKRAVDSKLECISFIKKLDASLEWIKKYFLLKQ